MEKTLLILWDIAGFGINPAIISEIFTSEKNNKAYFVFKGCEEVGLIQQYPSKECMNASIDTLLRECKKAKLKLITGLK